MWMLLLKIYNIRESFWFFFLWLCHVWLTALVYITLPRKLLSCCWQHRCCPQIFSAYNRVWKLELMKKKYFGLCFRPREFMQWIKTCPHRPDMKPSDIINPFKQEYYCTGFISSYQTIILRVVFICGERETVKKKKWSTKGQSTPAWQNSLKKKRKKKKNHCQTFKRGAALCGDINRGDKDNCGWCTTRVWIYPMLNFPPFGEGYFSFLLTQARLVSLSQSFLSYFEYCDAMWPLGRHDHILTTRTHIKREE